MIRYVPKEVEENINVSKSSALGELLRLIAGTMFCMAGLYLLLGLIVDLLIPFVPSDIEKSMGHAYTVSFKEKAQTSKDSRRLELILDRLITKAKLNPENYSVYLVESDEANALAIPGGSIVVLTGLLKQAKTDNAIAFVLAHEIGHFVHKDHLRELGREALFSTALSAMFGSDNRLQKLSHNSSRIFAMKFSQQQESDADAYALELLFKTEGHVQGAINFFEMLEQQDNSSLVKRFLSTHPAPHERLQSIKHQIAIHHYSLYR